MRCAGARSLPSFSAERAGRSRPLRSGAEHERGQASVEVAVSALVLALLLAVGLAALGLAFDLWRVQGASYAGARAELVGEDGERRASRFIDARPARRRGSEGGRDLEASRLGVDARHGRVRVEIEGRRGRLGRAVARSSASLDGSRSR